MAKDNDFVSGENAKSRECASIGPSITIKGEISGNEDLVVLGSVEGTINLRDNTVIVGKGAKVAANIFGNIIRVEGEVLGDLFGREQILVHHSGCVRGNITAPRLSLEDGARIKGSIDTETGAVESVSSLPIERMRTSDPRQLDVARKPIAAQPAVVRPQANGTTPQQ
jgi:cytoskeletal protein CcmA (bactofilin family)